MQLLTKDRSFYSKLISIAIPSSLQSLIMFGVNTADTVMVGSLGENSIAGVALGNQIAFLYQITCYGIAGGMGVLMAQFWGKNDREAIESGLSITTKIAAVFGLLFMMLAIFLPMQVLSLYTNDPLVRAEGVAYLKIVAISFIFLGLTTMISQALRSVEVVKLSLYSSCVALVVNIFCNWVFIFGNLGAPRLGVRGAAIATLVSRIAEFLIVTIYLLKIDKHIRFRLSALLHWDKGIFRNYMKNGSPVIVSDVILGVGSTMTSVVLGHMGAVVTSASSIANTIYHLTSIFLMGVANASGVITGNTVGAGEREKAKEYGKTFITISVLVSILAIAIIQLIKGVIFQEFNFGGNVIQVFNVELGTKELAGQLINSLSALTIFMTVSNVLTKGILRSGGDTKFLMVADVLFLWVISVPLGFITGLYLKWPPYIVFFLLRSDEVIKSVWCMFRFYSWKWIRDVAVR